MQLVWTNEATGVEENPSLVTNSLTISKNSFRLSIRTVYSTGNIACSLELVMEILYTISVKGQG